MKSWIAMVLAWAVSLVSLSTLEEGHVPDLPVLDGAPWWVAPILLLVAMAVKSYLQVGLPQGPPRRGQEILDRNPQTPAQGTDSSTATTAEHPVVPEPSITKPPERVPADVLTPRPRRGSDILHGSIALLVILGLSACATHVASVSPTHTWLEGEYAVEGSVDWDRGVATSESFSSSGALDAGTTIEIKVNRGLIRLTSEVTVAVVVDSEEGLVAVCWSAWEGRLEGCERYPIPEVSSGDEGARD